MDPVPDKFSSKTISWSKYRELKPRLVAMIDQWGGRSSKGMKIGVLDGTSRWEE